MSDETKKKSKFGCFLRTAIIFALVLVIGIVLFHLIENYRGKKEVDRVMTKLRAEGVPLELSEIIPPDVPDAENFGAHPLILAMMEKSDNADAIARIEVLALPYKEAEKIIDSGKINDIEIGDLQGWFDALAQSDKFDLDPNSKTPAEDLKKALAPQLATLDELFQATKRKYAQLSFTEFANLPVLEKFDYKNMLIVNGMSLQKQLKLFLEIAIATEDQGQAVKLIDLQLQIGDLADRSPCGIITILVNCAMRGRVFEQVNYLLEKNTLDDTHLLQLQESLDGGLDLMKEAAFDLNTEMVFGGFDVVDYFRDNRKEVLNWHKKFNAEISKLFTGVKEPDSLLEKAIDKADRFFWLYLLPDAWFDQNKANLVRFYRNGIEKLQQRNFEKLFDENAEDDFKKKYSVLSYKYFIGQFIASITSVTKRVSLYSIQTNSAITTCALERYRLASGDYPATLAELTTANFLEKIPIDMLDGQPLRYAKTSTGYKLWSIGRNLTDDGGKVFYKDKNKKRIDYDQGDWVWEISRATGQP